MNKPFLTITQNADKSWSFTWAAVTGASFYRLVLFGSQIAKQTATSYTFKIVGWDKAPPPLELVVDNGKACSELYVPFLTIQWYRIDGVVYYQIDEQVNGSWIKRATVSETGMQLLSQKMSPMADESAHVFRLRAADALGQFSAAREFDIGIVTPPRLVESNIRIRYNQSIHSLTVTGV